MAGPAGMYASASHILSPLSAAYTLTGSSLCWAFPAREYRPSTCQSLDPVLLLLLAVAAADHVQLAQDAQAKGQVAQPRVWLH